MKHGQFADRVLVIVLLVFGAIQIGIAVKLFICAVQIGGAAKFLEEQIDRAILGPESNAVVSIRDGSQSRSSVLESMGHDLILRASGAAVSMSYTEMCLGVLSVGVGALSLIRRPRVEPTGVGSSR